MTAAVANGLVSSASPRGPSSPLSASPALTLWQPRASLIAVGVKPFETRSRATRYRGPLAIHAGSDRRGLQPCRAHAAIMRALSTAGLTPDALPRGCILAVGEPSGAGLPRRSSRKVSTTPSATTAPAGSPGICTACVRCPSRCLASGCRACGVRRRPFEGIEPRRKEPA